ncbi:MAG: phosphoribosylaminoimidazolecarboxamide formyltransferase / cyclohydrolase [Thermoleophilaceae bacterium]|nr:phosphoribosylaminoimidazolecarboxamide formyltransferase / cyclohydrolase [Thermoleophilaceae bacterium]
MSIAESPQAEPVEPGAVRVGRALLSVSDKRGLIDFARGLVELGVEIVASGGTRRELGEAGIDTRSVDDYTGFPEILDGRVKTLNPKIHAGLLAVRSNPDHVRTMEEQGIEPIDLVCVNLYPFEQTAARLDVPDSEVIENIDVGGPTMIRAAAKNHAFVAVVVEPESYDAVLDEMRTSDGALSGPTRQALAADAFAQTARYDAAIASWFAERGADDFPPLLAAAWEKELDLSYGENPHQRAAYYSQTGSRSSLLSQVSQLHGKELSFNNLLDLDAARRLIEEFDQPAAVIVKHNNPCGVAVADSIGEAFERALDTDRLSAFGGVFCLNRQVDLALAEELHSIFVEIVFAPGYDDDALAVLEQKPNVRIMACQEKRDEREADWDSKRVRGGILVQDRDRHVDAREDMEVVTARQPTEDEWADLLFAWRVCRHVRSNAIVLARGQATLGVGAGQMSRVDSVKLAVEKSREWDASRTPPLQGAVMASDAFFPFPDGPQAGFDAGVTAVIQPGGSRNDPAVIEAADAAGAAMVLTSRRHFRH